MPNITIEHNKRSNIHSIEKAIVKHQTVEPLLGFKPKADKSISLPEYAEEAIYNGKGGGHISPDLRAKISEALLLGDLSKIGMSREEIIQLVDNKPGRS
jgi:hypothetical protein